jgi:hypothetical protein
MVAAPKEASMNTLKKWWPTLVAVIGAVAPIALPAVQGAISSHPKVATILAAAYAILAHLLPSPVTPTAK